MRRFYFPALAAPDAGPSDQSPLVLTGPEARHLALVLRLKPGDMVEFFDGLGQVVQARLQSVTPQQVRAVPVAAHAGRADSCPELVLAQALLKGRKMDLVVQKANELGVQRLLPLVTQFCEKREGGAAALARWQRIVIESCKQCRRALPMQIAAPAPLAGADFSWAKTRLVAWEGEHEAGLPFAPLEPAAGPLCLLVGPEGGLHQDEVAHLQSQGFRAFSLGALVLRAETAAISGLSVLRWLSGGLGSFADGRWS